MHGFDVYGAAAACRCAASELAEPSECNYHSLNTWLTEDTKDVTIIVGDFI